MPILKIRQTLSSSSSSLDSEGLSANDLEQLQKKIHQLPTLFSNYRLADHQIQPENLQNIMQHQQQIETQSSCDSTPSPSPGLTPKRSFFKKIFSFEAKAKESCINSSREETPSGRKKLTYQAMSLNAAFNSITNSHSSSTEMVPHSVIKEKLLGVQVNLRTLVDTRFKTDKTDKTLTTTTTTTNILETSPTSFSCPDQPHMSFFSLGLIFNRNNGSGVRKQNYKDKMKSVNVRRKSSMLARDNFLMIDNINRSSQSKYLTNRKEYLNSERIMNNATKRGSIHYKSSMKCDKLGMLMGVSDAKFRAKLIKLEKQYNDFNYASSQYLITPGSNRISRRKKAFDAIDIDENCSWELSDRLPYMVSSLSLIVGDDECQSNSEKLSQTKISLTNSLTDVNEDLINEKNNEIGRVTKWAIGFEKLLEDKLGLQIFTNFLKKEFSNENIDFWVKCENFKKITETDEMRRTASEIWSEYLDTSSMTQINVDSKARSHCKEALQNPNSGMFEKAQTHIFNLMRYDSYSRFLKSQMYKDCIVNEMSGKPLISNDSNRPLNNGATTSAGVNPGGDSQKTPTNNYDIVKSFNENSSVPSASANLAAAVQIAASTTGSVVLSQNNNSAVVLHTPSAPSSPIIPSSSDSPNKKEKKKTMSTILPWTKGKSKKAQNEVSINQVAPSISVSGGGIGGSSSSVSGTKSPNVLFKGLVPKGSPTNSSNYFFNSNSDSRSINSENNENNTSTYLNTSLTIGNQVDGKFCRVLYSNDGSSTMIQTSPGQTVYQILKKIFNKKQIPWYKCDLYYVDENNVVDQHVDSQVIGSKEICLVERCLFVLSLLPIAINVCVKASFKKTIGSVLKPIFESYQIKIPDCSIFLNTTNTSVNLLDFCSNLDNQNILVIHKNQTNLLSNEEIDKYSNLSINDFIPNTLQDYQLQFDELGILKHCKPKSQVKLTNSPASTVLNTNADTDMSAVNSNDKQGNFIDMLNRVQKFSFEDQRGPIDTENLKVPEFLLNTSLTKAQSLQQNLNIRKSPNTHLADTSLSKLKLNPNNTSLHNTQSFSQTTFKNSNTVSYSNKSGLLSRFNESTSSLPTGLSSQRFTTTEATDSQKAFISRSRSPMIVYDNDEENNIDESCIFADNSLHNNQNLSASFLYEADTNVIMEENELENNINSRSDSMRINNSGLSMNFNNSPNRSSSNVGNSTSRISYV